MRRIISIFALCALAAGLDSAALAQTSPTQTQAGYSLPWNDLMPTREWRKNYATIVGTPGAQLVPGSNNASPYGASFPIPLPFDMEFLGSIYPAGSTVYAGIGGYLAFAASPGTAPYVLMPHAAYTGVIMPYWSDLRTTSQPQQGIYTRYSVDPGTGDSTWTLEWNVETISFPAATGHFQLQIIKRGLWSGISVPVVEYAFIYDRNTPLPRSVPPGYGAQIGIKNLGQPAGPPPPLGPASDNEMFMLLTPPSVYPATPAITRLPTRQSGTQSFTPDWYASAVSPASSYFHYTVPDSIMRVKPIDADAGCVKKGNDSGQFSYAPIYPPGTPITGTVHVINHGVIPQGSLPVTVHLIKGGRRIDSFETKITFIDARDTVPVKFSLTAKETGAYQAVAVVSARVDQNRGNDTVTWRLFVRPRIDVSPVQILSPRMDGSVLYSTKGEIGVSVYIANLGTGVPKQIFTHAVIRDTGNVVIKEYRDTSGQVLEPGQTRAVALGMIKLPAGRYFIDAWSSADGDEITGNDSLTGIQRIDWTGYGTTPEARRPAPKPFTVYLAADLGVGDPGLFPHLPRREDTIRGASMVLATFMNVGAHSVSGARGRIIIRNVGDMVVYDTTMTLPELAGGGGYQWPVFPDFTPPRDGRYCAEAFIDTKLFDDNQTNDVIRWCFFADVADTVDTTSSVAIVTGAGSGAVEVSPNPASGLVLVTWSGATPGRARLTITDAAGVDLIETLHDSHGGRQTATLDAARLASGYYLVRIEEPDGRRRIVPLVVRR